MTCRIADMRQKEVINLHNGMRLGYVDDVEINILEGNLSAIIIGGALKFFGLLGRYDDIVIPFEKIEKIGDDLILVNFEYIPPYEPRKNWLKF